MDLIHSILGTGEVGLGPKQSFTKTHTETEERGTREESLSSRECGLTPVSADFLARAHRSIYTPPGFLGGSFLRFNHGW